MMLTNAEFLNSNNAIWALCGFTAWAIHYFNVFKISEISIPGTLVSRSRSLSVLKWLLCLVGFTAWAMIGVALMGPREPVGKVQSQKEMNDIYFVVDVSRSMFAEDFPPNRIEAAKQRIKEFVKLSPVDRIGIIMFSDEVYTLIPATTDLGLVEKSVDDIRIGPLGAGTNIGDALGLAIARSTSSIAENKAVILLTDGASNVGLLSPSQAAEKAKELGVRIYTIGIGGDPRAKLPMGRDAFGRKRYAKMPGGSMDFETLNNIAKISNGKSFVAGNNDSLKDVLKEIEKLERKKIDVSGRVIYKELYLNYLIVGLILFLSVEIFRRLVLREVSV